MSLTKISCLLLPLLALSVSAASNLVFKKIEVQVGAVGSDDDIRIKICSGATCCSTDKLSNLLGREWVKNKKGEDTNVNLQTADGRFHYVEDGEEICFS